MLVLKRRLRKTECVGRMYRSAGLLVAITLVCWVIATGPVVWITGWQGVGTNTLACVVCLIPAAFSLLFGLWSLNQNQNWQLLAILGGGGLRMGVVFLVAATLAWRLGWAGQHLILFAGLLVFYYLTTLATETLVLVRLWRPRQPSRFER